MSDVARPGHSPAGQATRTRIFIHRRSHRERTHLPRRRRLPARSGGGRPVRLRFLPGASMCMARYGHQALPQSSFDWARTRLTGSVDGRLVTIWAHMLGFRFNLLTRVCGVLLAQPGRQHGITAQHVSMHPLIPFSALHELGIITTNPFTPVAVETIATVTRQGLCIFSDNTQKFFEIPRLPCRPSFN
jgi:hypothetical protein